jgi:hypothetical protein
MITVLDRLLNAAESRDGHVRRHAESNVRMGEAHQVRDKGASQQRKPPSCPAARRKARSKGDFPSIRRYARLARLGKPYISRIPFLEFGNRKFISEEWSLTRGTTSRLGTVMGRLGNSMKEAKKRLV